MVYRTFALCSSFSFGGTRERQLPAQSFESLTLTHHSVSRLLLQPRFPMKATPLLPYLRAWCSRSLHRVLAATHIPRYHELCVR